jgi:hypothetical protein
MAQAVVSLAEMETDLEARRTTRTGGSRGGGAWGDGEGAVEEATFFYLPP